MKFPTRYFSILLVLFCFCMLMLVSACGGATSTIVTPGTDKGAEIVQPTPSESPFPVHHSPASNAAP